MNATTSATELTALLWGHLKKRALKRKTLTRADAAQMLEVGVDDVPTFAWPVHVWCWVRGMPPLNIVLVKRGKTPDSDGGFTTPDYDVFHEALGRSVYTLEDAWFYPWEKVTDPTEEALAWALALYDEHRELLLRFRELDLELELRERDEARGRKRPVPRGQDSWRTVLEARAELTQKFAALGVTSTDLRPPGKGPYPPPRPVTGNWAD